MNIDVNISGHLEAYDHEAITVDNTVGGVGLTASKLNPTQDGPNRDLGPCRMVILNVEGADTRYTVHHSGAPVAMTTGHLLQQGSYMSISNRQMLREFRIIRETGTSATIHVTYYR